MRMNKPQNRFIILLKLFFLNIFLFIILFSCATSQKAHKKNDGSNDVDPLISPINPIGNGTLLSLPTKNELAEKRMGSRLSKSIENGSPKSLADAKFFIQNDNKGFTPENRVYLKIIDDIIYILYPELSNSNYNSSTEEDQYLVGLHAVKNGSYPATMKKNEFLSLIIPPLILSTQNVTSSMIKEFSSDMFERLELAKKLNPTSVLPHYLLGILHEKQYSITEAMFEYKTAWQLDNSCYTAGLRYGQLSAESGDGITAIKIADTLSKQSFDVVSEKLLYARGHIALANFTKADEYIVDVLKNDPENMTALILRIRTLLEKKEYLKANSLLNAYSAKNKTSREYLLYSAKLSREWSKNVIEATGYLNEAYVLYPEDIHVLLACAEICFENSQEIAEKSADFFISRIVEKDADNVTALSLLAKNGINSGNADAAVNFAQKLVNKIPSNSNKEILARAYLVAKNYDAAIVIARQLYLSSKKNEANSFITLYVEALYYAKNYQGIMQIIKEKLPNADSELKSVLYYYNAKTSNTSAEEYLSLLRSSLLANPRNQQSLFAMYNWYFSSKDYRKAKYYLGQVLALDPTNKKNRDLAEKLDKLLDD